MDTFFWLRISMHVQAHCLTMWLITPIYISHFHQTIWWSLCGQHYGRELLDLYIASRLRIINSRTRPGNNNLKVLSLVLPLEEQACMVDYTIVSDDFINYVSHFQVGDISSFSDHCPLYLHLSTEPGSFFHISRMNMLSKNLLQDMLEGIHCKKKRVVLTQVGYLCFIPLMFR